MRHRAQQRRARMLATLVLGALAFLADGPVAAAPPPEGEPTTEAPPAPAPPARPLTSVYRWRTARPADLRSAGPANLLRAADEAASSGIDWLLRHQGPNGLWSAAGFGKNCPGGACEGPGLAAHDVGVSGLALLALLARGLPEDPARALALRRGLDAIVALQDTDGCFGPRTDRRFLYDHSIALTAVAEAAELTRDPALLQSAERGARFLGSAQNPNRGWRYGVRPGNDDTSTTSWAVLAMCATEWSGAQVPADTYSGARQWLDKVTDPETGSLGYAMRGDGDDSPFRTRRTDAPPAPWSADGITAAGVASRQWLATPTRPDPWIAKGVRVVGLFPIENPPDLHTLYWATLVLFQEGGKTWQTWQERTVPALRDGQAGGTACSRGSWSPDGPWGPQGGRVYSTAISVLTLITPWRFAQFSQSPPPRTALRLDSVPEGARVLLDGRRAGSTPFDLFPAPHGKMRITLVFPGRTDAEVTVEIRPLETTDLGRVALAPGTPVTLAALPPDAELYAEGHRVRDGDPVRPGAARFVLVRKAHRSAIVRAQVSSGGPWAFVPPETPPAPEWSGAAVRGLPGPTGPAPDPKTPLPAGISLRDGRIYCDTDGSEMALACVPGTKDVPPRRFLIDRTEVTVAQYRRFARKSGATVPEQPGGSVDQPVIGVSWEQAAAYALWAGKRLPLEEEWVAASRAGDPCSEGPSELQFPWGEFPCSTASIEAYGSPRPRTKPERVASLTAGMSADGCFDLRGNAAEWARDHREDSRLLVGGGYALRPTRHTPWKEDDQQPDAGFRCVADLP